MALKAHSRVHPGEGVCKGSGAGMKINYKYTSLSVTYCLAHLRYTPLYSVPAVLRRPTEGSNCFRVGASRRSVGQTQRRPGAGRSEIRGRQSLRISGDPFNSILSFKAPMTMPVTTLALRMCLSQRDA